MARLISSIATKPRHPIEQARIDAARKFHIGQDVYTFANRNGKKRYGKVKEIDHSTGIITIASGSRTQRFAADFVEKND
ncbi:hypothetical protein JNK62_04745 [bacterium]|nr:hypothetical protein [bacterium]